MIGGSVPSVLLEVAAHELHDPFLDVFNFLAAVVLDPDHFEVVVKTIAAQIQFFHLKYEYSACLLSLH